MLSRKKSVLKGTVKRLPDKFILVSSVKPANVALRIELMRFVERSRVCNDSEVKASGISDIKLFDRSISTNSGSPKIHIKLT